jgi:hypothetical protein
MNFFYINVWLQRTELDNMFTDWRLLWLNLINLSVCHFSSPFRTILIVTRDLWLPELRKRRFCLRCPFEASPP